MSGKGDDVRPLSVDYRTYSNNWERVFGKHPREQRLEAPREESTPPPVEDTPPE
jgi:hypothetical protein